VQISGEVGGHVVVGDHNVVIQAHGSAVTVRGGPTPTIRRRDRPVGQALPRPGRLLVGRDAELAQLSGWLDDGVPIQVHGPPGVGKSALLRRFAVDRAASGADVVFMSAAGLAAEDIVQELFQLCYDVEDYRPEPVRLRRLMGAIQALFVVDDFEGSAADLMTVLDAVPSSDLAVASRNRSIGSEGRCLEVRGLAEDAALTLIESELGREARGEDAEAARRLCRAARGNPRVLLRATAASAAAGGRVITDLDVLTPALVGGLDSAARTALDVLCALPGLPVSPQMLTTLTGIAYSAEALAQLQQARLAEPVGTGYVLTAASDISASDISASDISAAATGPASDAAGYARTLAQWARTAAPHQIAEAAPLVVGVLTAAVRAGAHEPARDLARAAAPALGRTLRWGAWRHVLALGREAAHHLGATEDEAYFAGEDQVRRRALGLSAGLAAVAVGGVTGGAVGGAAVTAHNVLAATGGKVIAGALALPPVGIAAAVATAVAAVAIGAIGANVVNTDDGRPASASGASGASDPGTPPAEVSPVTTRPAVKPLASAPTPAGAVRPTPSVASQFSPPGTTSAKPGILQLLPQPSLAIPSEIAISDIYTATVSGFSPGEQVRVTLIGHSSVPGVVTTAGPDGQATVHIDQGAAPGKYTILAVGLTSGHITSAVLQIVR
jgi:hypothetical protein